MKLTRANAPGDYANFFTHFGLMAGIAGGVLMTLGFPPVAGAIALGWTAWIKLGFGPKIVNVIQDTIDDARKNSRERVQDRGFLKVLIPGKGVSKDIEYKTFEESKFIKNANSQFGRRKGEQPNDERIYERQKSKEEILYDKVEGWVEKYARQLGLSKTPQILIMGDGDSVRRESRRSKKYMGKTFLDVFNKHANAFAFTHEKSNVVLTAPLVENLNEKELQGVVAHEVGHIAAGHSRHRNLMSYIHIPVRMMTGLNQLFTVVTSIKNIGLYIGASAIGGSVGAAYGILGGLDPDNKAHKAKVELISYYTQQAALAGLATVFAAPEVLVAQGIHFFTKESFDLVSKRQSRCNEFQADRLGATVTENPEAMCDALHKIRQSHLKSAPDFKNKPEAPRTVLSDVFGHIQDIKKTHPNINRRCDALMELRAATPSMALA